VRDPRIHVGLVAADPQELGRREPCERPVPGELDQPLETDGALDLLALGRRALVIPEDGGPQRLKTVVQEHEAVHLAREADPGHVRDGQLAQRRVGRPPPQLRVLLGVPGGGCADRVLGPCTGEDRAVRGDRDRLRRARADVEPDERAHAWRPA